MLDDQRGAFPAPGEAVPIGRTMMLYGAARGAAILGWSEAARVLYPLIAERAEGLPLADFFDLALAQRIAGMAAAAAGLWDQAEDHFERASRQVDEFPNRVDRPPVLHWHAKMLLDRGDTADRERARGMLVEALAGYRELGMPTYAAMVEALLG